MSTLSVHDQVRVYLAQWADYDAREAYIAMVKDDEFVPPIPPDLWGDLVVEEGSSQAATRCVARILRARVLS